tara:strand:+ start:1162 stop:1728 length:567 start_codon:yes stop_codon:yes gene_type:complete
MIGGKLTYIDGKFVASNKQLYSVIEANLMNRLNIKPVDNNQGLLIDNERDERYIDNIDNKRISLLNSIRNYIDTLNKKDKIDYIMNWKMVISLRNFQDNRLNDNSHVRFTKKLRELIVDRLTERLTRTSLPLKIKHTLYRSNSNSNSNSHPYPKRQKTSKGKNKKIKKTKPKPKKQSRNKRSSYKHKK